jgi:hypothetical protein
MIAHGTPRSAGHRLNAPRPLEQNDMPRSAVKRILRNSENWNLPVALKQQGGLVARTMRGEGKGFS